MRLPPRADLLAPLGRWVELQRLQLGWTQAQLATYARVSKNTVWHLEAARHRATKANLENILHVLRDSEDVAAGVSLPVLRAPWYLPRQAQQDAGRVLLQGGQYDPMWFCVFSGDAGSWLMLSGRDEARIAELQAPFVNLLAELERSHRPTLEEVLILGLGAGHQPTELVREVAARTVLQSVWLIDASPMLLLNAERQVGQVADGLSITRRRSGRWGNHLSPIGVQALCADYRDGLGMKRLFEGERIFPRLVILGAGALDLALDDWRDLGAAAALASRPGDLLMVEYRVPPADESADAVERLRAEWWSLYLQGVARNARAAVVSTPKTSETILERALVPSSLPGVKSEDRVARLRSYGETAEREIRLHWRRAYEPDSIERWLAAHSLRCVGHWPYRFGSRTWALFERGDGSP